MSDLISRQEVIEWLVGKRYITVDETSDTMSEDFENKHRWELSRNCFINDAIKHIQEQPTIEAEPVVHGEWVDNGERDKHGVPKPFAISCSICGSSAGTHWMKYCTNCGADMRGDQNE